MKNLLIALSMSLGALTLGMTPIEADAKRLGGGKPAGMQRQAHQAADDRAVETDELQVLPDIGLELFDDRLRIPRADGFRDQLGHIRPVPVAGDTPPPAAAKEAVPV